MHSIGPIIFLVLLSISAFGEDKNPTVRTLNPALQPGTECLNAQYLVYAPTEKTDAKWPLLIFLHGAGGVGNDIQQSKVRGKPDEIWHSIEKFNKEPCIVVAPQCLEQSKNGGRGIWTPADLNILLEDLKATLPLDAHRVYLSGVSMGGYGTWAWAAHDPQHFAAIAPIVGGLGPDGPKDVTPDFEQWAVNLARIPVYAFVGAKDQTVPPERSERMIAAIQRAGGKAAKIKVYPEEGHGAARVVVASEEYYDWIFSKKQR